MQSTYSTKDVLYDWRNWDKEGIRKGREGTRKGRILGLIKIGVVDNHKNKNSYYWIKRKRANRAFCQFYSILTPQNHRYHTFNPFQRPILRVARLGTFTFAHCPCGPWEGL